jgi:hypothetical protein
LAKVQLIGARETAAIAAELTATYGEALLKLMGAAKPMYDLKVDIKNAGDLYDQQFDQARRVLGEITSENESGTPDPVRIATLHRSFDHYRERYMTYADERNTAWEAFNSHNRAFVRAVFNEVKKIAPLQIMLTCGIRSEIGLDTDASELKLRLDDNQARATKAIDELLEKLDPPAVS